MSPYIFVLATVIALIPLLIIFKVFIDKLKENPEAREKITVRFIIGAALSEVIPILLIIYAFVQKQTVQGFDEILMPILIILLLVGVAIFFIFLQKKIGVSKDSKKAVSHFISLVILFINTIPLLALVGLFMMLSE